MDTSRRVTGGARNGWRRGIVVLLALWAAGRAGADFTESWDGSQALPDNDPSGWTYTFTPSAPVADVTDVNVTLQIDGGFNGDLFAYLVHAGGYAVLLNRTGRDTGLIYGYSDPGFSITLDDEAPLVGGVTAPDIHVYQSLSPSYDGNGRLTGLWQPDARTADPASVVAGSPRTAYLSSLDGLTSDGSWTLFLADMSPGGVSTVEGFSIDVTQIPEPSALGLAFAVGLVAWRIRRWRTRPSDPAGLRAPAADGGPKAGA